MKIMRRRRSAFTTGTIAVLALWLAACSAPPEPGASATTSGVSPVVVDTSSGKVTINTVPKRIVALGDQWTDVVVAFGVTPVAFSSALKAESGSDAPWTAGKLAGSTSIPLTSGDRVSQVAAAKPDLILLPGYGMDAAEIDKYKQLAPTITGVSDADVAPWQDQVTLMGKVLRQDGKATSIIGSVQEKIDALKAANPGLAGKSITFAFLFSADQIMVFGDPNDGSAALFGDLGLVIPSRLQQIAKQQKTARFPVSTENIPELNSDLLVVSAGSPQLFAALQTLPGYAQLDSVRDNAVAQLDLVSITALNLPSPLSIPYVLDKLKPALSAASR